MKKYTINEELTKWTNKLACDLANKTVDRLNNLDIKINIEDIIWEVIFDFSTTLDCCDNEWLILQIYCMPWNCDLTFAKRELYNDIYNLIEEVEE